MKYLKTFENYVKADPINFENVFGISDLDLSYILGDLIDKYDYLEFDLTTDDYKTFKIEIFEDGLEADPTQNLEDEYKLFKDTIAGNLKIWLDENNLKLDKHEYNKGSNKIVITVSKIEVNEGYNKPRKGMKSRWSTKYKKSINCNNPKGFSQRQFCKRKRRGGAYKD